MTPEEMDQRARACLFPGYEPAFIQVGDRRLHVIPQSANSLRPPPCLSER